MSERNKTIVIGGVYCCLFSGIIALIVWLATPHTHTIDVKTIEWRYTVQIQEYQQCSGSGWNLPPDAYDVITETRRRGSTSVRVGENTVHVPRYDTYYHYKIDEWCDSRQVTTGGADKSPYWGKFQLKGNGEQAIGNERVSARIEEYTVSGTESDGAELVSIRVSRDIWEQITTADQLNYSKRKIGNPFNVVIAG